MDDAIQRGYKSQFHLQQTNTRTTFSFICEIYVSVQDNSLILSSQISSARYMLLIIPGHSKLFV